MFNQLLDKIAHWIADNADYDREGDATIDVFKLLKYLQSLKIQ
jgi:hypothetical protein